MSPLMDLPIVPHPLQFLAPELFRVSFFVSPKFPSNSVTDLITDLNEVWRNLDADEDTLWTWIEGRRGHDLASTYWSADQVQLPRVLRTTEISVLACQSRAVCTGRSAL